LLPMVLPFETPALSGIVPALDVIENIRSGFRSRPVLPAIHALAFERSKDTFCRGHYRRRCEELLIFHKGSWPARWLCEAGARCLARRLLSWHPSAAKCPGADRRAVGSELPRQWSHLRRSVDLAIRASPGRLWRDL